jgi:hypothetical protein
MRPQASTEVMGIDMLVNANGDTTNANYHQHQHQHHQHHHQLSIPPMPSPDQMSLPLGPRSVADPLERSGSPHGSIHSMHSRYSTPRPGDISETLPRSYPSPTPMLHPHEHHLPPAMAAHGMPPTTAAQQYQTEYKPAVLPGGWNQTIQAMPAQQPTVSQGPVKAYPCGTCGKGFARRSDLARHG